MTGARDFVLLGIKYESARIAEVSDAALDNIAQQLQDEAGEGWETDPLILRGRNAVRQEHGLDKLGEPAGNTAHESPTPRRRWRFFGRRS